MSIEAAAAVQNNCDRSAASLLIEKLNDFSKIRLQNVKMEFSPRSHFIDAIRSKHRDNLLISGLIVNSKTGDNNTLTISVQDLIERNENDLHPFSIPLPGQSTRFCFDFCAKILDYMHPNSMINNELPPLAFEFCPELNELYINLKLHNEVSKYKFEEFDSHFKYFVASSACVNSTRGQTTGIYGLIEKSALFPEKEPDGQIIKSISQLNLLNFDTDPRIQDFVTYLSQCSYEKSKYLDLSKCDDSTTSIIGLWLLVATSNDLDSSKDSKQCHTTLISTIIEAIKRFIATYIEGNIALKKKTSFLLYIINDNRSKDLKSSDYIDVNRGLMLKCTISSSMLDCDYHSSIEIDALDESQNAGKNLSIDLDKGKVLRHFKKIEAPQSEENIKEEEKVDSHSFKDLLHKIKEKLENFEVNIKELDKKIDIINLKFDQYPNPHSKVDDKQSFDTSPNKSPSRKDENQFQSLIKGIQRLVRAESAPDSDTGSNFHHHSVNQQDNTTRTDTLIQNTYGLAQSNLTINTRQYLNNFNLIGDGSSKPAATHHKPDYFDNENFGSNAAADISAFPSTQPLTSSTRKPPIIHNQILDIDKIKQMPKLL